MTDHAEVPRRGATPRPRSGVVMRVPGCVRAGGPRGTTPRSRSGGATSSKVKSSYEETPHVQGKRNPSKTVGFARGHQRADLKPYSQKTSQSDHTDHSLV